jgi:hypothetical protein
MKIFIVSVFIALSSSFAFSDLPQYINSFDKSKWSLESSYLSDLPILFSKYSELIGEFDFESCRKSVQISYVVNKKTKNRYKIMSTVEDKCDGGNSYGLLLNVNSKETVVAIIRDSAIEKIDN